MYCTYFVKTYAVKYGVGAWYFNVYNCSEWGQGLGISWFWKLSPSGPRRGWLNHKRSDNADPRKHCVYLRTVFTTKQRILACLSIVHKCLRQGQRLGFVWHKQFQNKSIVWHKRVQNRFIQNQPINIVLKTWCEICFMCREREKRGQSGHGPLRSKSSESPSLSTTLI